MLSQFDVVDVIGRPVFEHKNQFMLRAVERPHACIVFDPNADVLEGEAAGGLQEMLGVPPIHAGEANGAVLCESCNFLKRGRQEVSELLIRHFTGRHREFGMFDRAQTASVAVDRNVVRGVGEDHLGAIGSEQCHIWSAFECVPAAKQVIAEHPHIATLRNRANVGPFGQHVRTVIGFLDAQKDVNLSRIEAHGGEIIVDIQFAQKVQFSSETLFVPGGELCQPIVSDDKGPLVCLAEMAGPNSWDGSHTQLSSCLDPGMTAKQRSILVNDNR